MSRRVYSVRRTNYSRKAGRKEILSTGLDLQEQQRIKTQNKVINHRKAFRLVWKLFTYRKNHFQHKLLFTAFGVLFIDLLIIIIII